MATQFLIDEANGVAILQHPNGDLQEITLKSVVQAKQPKVIIGQLAAAKYLGLDDGASFAVSRLVIDKLLATSGKRGKAQVFETSELDRLLRERPELISQIQNRTRRNKSSV